ncbi:hypothetical protein ANO11243_071780 [Dothideomycetidae sp. 11243]|nr:hypothetical protein ANO11243_071780 [fungal sp. No.11243]
MAGDHTSSTGISRPLVFLATCSIFPEGEAGGVHLSSVLAKRGIDSSWVSWNDPAVDWDSADIIAIRSTWDYDSHLEEFLDWAARLDPTKLLNPAAALRWNINKAYLIALQAAGVPTVPTVYAETVNAVHKAIPTGEKAVVKPATGVNGFGVEVVLGPDASWVPSWKGPWVVQPFVESVQIEGERAVFMLDGKVTIQLLKTAAVGQFRINEDYGGRTAQEPLSDDAVAIANMAVNAAEEILGTKLGYARVDLLRYNGRLVVSELEITEPGLYLDIVPAHAEPYADLIQRRISSRP